MTGKARDQRVIEQFDPTTELAHRYPQWRVEVVPMLTCEEVWLHDQRVIHVAEADPERVRMYLAHVLGHLAMGHDRECGDWFTQDQEGQADWLVEVYLDKPQREAG